MITTELSRTGLPVLKKNGRLLGSSFDPLKEARAWAEKVVQGAKQGSETEIGFAVLGLASGYHVAELKKLAPLAPLVVIEKDREIAEEALRICPLVSPHEVVVESDWLKIVDHPRVRDVICGIYRIASHGPSCQLDQEFYAAAESFLRGRDKVSFLLQLKARPELMALLDPKAIAEIQNEAISVKTLQKIFGPHALASRERRLWRVLEELVL